MVDHNILWAEPSASTRCSRGSSSSRVSGCATGPAHLEAAPSSGVMSTISSPVHFIAWPDDTAVDDRELAIGRIQNRSELRVERDWRRLQPRRPAAEQQPQPVRSPLPRAAPAIDDRCGHDRRRRWRRSTRAARRSPLRPHCRRRRWRRRRGRRCGQRWRRVGDARRWRRRGGRLRLARWPRWRTGGGVVDGRRR